MATCLNVISIDFYVAVLCVCVQVEPNSIAARDGRIKEGDRILQVCNVISVTQALSDEAL